MINFFKNDKHKEKIYKDIKGIFVNNKIKNIEYIVAQDDAMNSYKRYCPAGKITIYFENDEIISIASNSEMTITYSNREEKLLELNEINTRLKTELQEVDNRIKELQK